MRAGHGIKNGNVKHFFGRGPLHVATKVIEIRDDKDCEDGGLRNNEAHHGDRAATGLGPCILMIAVLQGNGSHVLLLANYSNAESESSGCFRSHNGRRLKTSGSIAKL